MSSKTPRYPPIWACQPHALRTGIDAFYHLWDSCRHWMETRLSFEGRMKNPRGPEYFRGIIASLIEFSPAHRADALPTCRVKKWSKISDRNPCLGSRAGVRQSQFFIFYFLGCLENSLSSWTPPAIIWNFPQFRQNSVMIKAKKTDFKENSATLCKLLHDLHPQNSPNFCRIMLHWKYILQMFNLGRCRSVHILQILTWNFIL